LPRVPRGVEVAGNAVRLGEVDIDRTEQSDAHPPIVTMLDRSAYRFPYRYRRRMSSTVEVTRDGPVALIRMNRPEVHNALDPATCDLLLATVRAAAADETVGAIVLTGGSRAFTTGEDLVTAAGLSEAEMRAQAGQFQELATALRFAPQPVVAAVGGYAYGGGLEIAVNCDLRIAGDNARFACPEVQWSLTLSNGSSVLLRRLVGEGWARELLLFGTVLDAEQALRIGLVTRVVPVAELEQHAMAAAHKAAGYARNAVRLTKDLLNADSRPWQSTLDAEAAAVLAGFGDPELQERLRRFAERKRA
jgi:enoyl-CoA hydratase/carnithine racemase